MYELAVEAEFAAAHRLNGYKGACERLHGHNWRVVAVVRSTELNELGMVLDFKDLRAHLEAVLDRLDHMYLNDVPPFDEENPTTECIARHVAEALAGRLTEPVEVDRVQVWESQGSCATYLACEPAQRR